MINRFNFLIPILVMAIGLFACHKPSNDATLKQNNDFAKETQLADSAYNMAYFGDSAKAALLTHELIKMADSLSPGLAQADAYRTAAMVYGVWSSYENAFFYYRKTEQILSTIEGEDAEKLKAKTWLNISFLYVTGGEYQQAIDYALKGEAIFTQYEMYSYLINAYAKVGEVYERLGNTERVNEYDEKVFNLTDKATDPFTLVTCYLNNSNLLSNQGKYNESFNWLNKTEALADSNGFLEAKINCLMNKAILYKMGTPDYEKALNVLFAAQPYIDEFHNPFQKADAFMRIANTYLQMGKNKEAIEYINKSQAIAIQFNLLDIQRRNVSILADVYVKKGWYKQANEQHKLFEELTKKYYTEQSTRDMLFLNARYEAQNREVQIKQLETANELNKAKLVKKNIIIVGSCIILLLVTIVAIVWIDWYRQKQKVTIQEQRIQAQRIEQLEREKELIALHATLKGEETERGRIARDLHDGLGGLLSGVKLSIHNMKDNFLITNEMAAAFNQAINLIDTSVKELRRVAHNMMPEILNQSGLHGALESFCYSLPEVKDVIIRYNFFGESQRLNLGFELAVYRIAQELVNNAIKHSQASIIQVQLLQDTERICITVSDNGSGMDPNTIPSDGKGLLGIRSRVASFGGRIDINSSPGDGTEFLVEFLNPETIESHD